MSDQSKLIIDYTPPNYARSLYVDLEGRPHAELDCLGVVREYLLGIARELPPGAFPPDGRGMDGDEACKWIYLADEAWEKVGTTVRDAKLLGDVLLCMVGDPPNPGMRPHVSVVVYLSWPALVLSSNRKRGCYTTRLGNVRGVVGVYRLRAKAVSLP